MKMQDASKEITVLSALDPSLIAGRLVLFQERLSLLVTTVDKAFDFIQSLDPQHYYEFFEDENSLVKIQDRSVWHSPEKSAEAGRLLEKVLGLSEKEMVEVVKFHLATKSVETKEQLGLCLALGEVTLDWMWAAAMVGHGTCRAWFDEPAHYWTPREFFEQCWWLDYRKLARDVADYTLSYAPVPTVQRFYSQELLVAKKVMDLLPRIKDTDADEEMCFSDFKSLEREGVTQLAALSDVWNLQMTTVAYCALVHGGSSRKFPVNSHKRPWVEALERLVSTAIEARWTFIRLEGSRGADRHAFYDENLWCEAKKCVFKILADAALAVIS